MTKLSRAITTTNLTNSPGRSKLDKILRSNFNERDKIWQSMCELTHSNVDILDSGLFAAVVIVIVE